MTLILGLMLGLSTVLTYSGQDELSRLVDALQLKYKRLTTLGADFTQVYTAPGERVRRETGHLLLKKPGKMRWDYTSPEAKIYVSDGRVIFEYVPSEGIATRIGVKDASDLRAPFMFLLGRGDLRRDFKQIEFATEAPANAGNRVLRLLPRKAQEFGELLIEIEPVALRLARLSFVDNEGARSDFIFSNVRENIEAADGQFKFQPPPGVRVVSE